MSAKLGVKTELDGQGDAKKEFDGQGDAKKELDGQGDAKKEPAGFAKGKNGSASSRSSSTRSHSRGTSVVSNSGGSGFQGRGRRRDEKPIMIKRGATGTVKFFNYTSRYGFISVDPEEDAEDQKPRSDEEKQPPLVIFVHFTSIVTQRPIYCALRIGDRLEFDIVHGLKGMEAVAVTLLKGYKVPGTIPYGARRFNRPPPLHYNVNNRQIPAQQSQSDVEVAAKEEGRSKRNNKRRNRHRRSSVVSNRTASEGDRSEPEERSAADDNKQQDGGDKRKPRGRGSRNNPRRGRQPSKKDGDLKEPQPVQQSA